MATKSIKSRQVLAQKQIQRSLFKTIIIIKNIIRQTACMVVNPITVGNFAFLFNCIPVGRTLDSMMVPTERLTYR